MENRQSDGVGWSQHYGGQLFVPGNAIPHQVEWHRGKTAENRVSGRRGGLRLLAAVEN